MKKDEKGGSREKERGREPGLVLSARKDPGPPGICRRTIEKYLRTTPRGRGSINFFIPAVWKIGFYSK